MILGFTQSTQSTQRIPSVLPASLREMILGFTQSTQSTQRILSVLPASLREMILGFTQSTQSTQRILSVFPASLREMILGYHAKTQRRKDAKKSHSPGVILQESFNRYKIMFKLFIILHFLLPAKNRTCDCDHVLSFEESETVFKGKVLEIKKIEEPFIRYEIKLKLIKKFKGDLKNDVIIVNTPCLIEGCCGIPFVEGAKFMVYTFDKDGLSYTNLCTLTRKLK